MTLQKTLRYLFILFALAFLSACGSSDPVSSTPTLKSSVITVDGKPVSGLKFSSTGGATDTSGTTASNGKFTYSDGSQVTISLGSTVIGTKSAASLNDGGALTLESLIDAYTGSDPLVLDMVALLTENTDPATGYITVPENITELNPLQDGVLLVNGKPVANASFSAASTSGQRVLNRNIVLINGTTDSNGKFKFDPLTTVTFKIGGIVIGSIDGALISADSQQVTIESLLANNPDAATNPTLQRLAAILQENQGVSVEGYVLPDNLAELDAVSATILTLGGKPVSGVAYVSGTLSGATSQNGVFTQDGTKAIAFQVVGLELGSVANDELPTSIEALVAASNSTNPLIQNLTVLLNELNAADASNPIASFRLYDLEQQLLKPSSLPENRVLGINLETPQAESDHISQPLITADIFRMARPFQESSCPDIVYTAENWPKSIPESCQNADTANGISKYAFTRILQFAPGLSFPEGKYTVLYDGKGNVSYSGMGCNVVRVVSPGHDTIDVKAANACPNPSTGTAGDNYKNKRGLEISITATDSSDPIRNFRVIMPGGICKGNPFDLMASASACADEPFVSFVELLKHNRNAIVFNPAFLKFARDFRVLRMMNIMEASPRRPESQTYNPCPATTDPTYEACLLQRASWEDRPTMNSPYWGGSYKTSVLQRQGVPLELTIALANQLQAHPWFTVPHNADDSYVNKYATMIADELDDNLVAHVEYSNEVWNAGFWGHHYAQQMGYNDAEISAMDDYSYRDTNYSVRTRYYAKRATEVFKLFEAEFADNTRLKRILGGQHKFHSLADNLLDYQDTKDHTDAVAIAPYFHGCWSRQFINGAGDTVDHSSCYNTDTVPMTMSEVTSLDQVFEVMDGEYDDSVINASLRGDADNVAATIKLIQPQIDVANDYGVELYAYEGGAHLTVSWGDTLVTDARKNSLWDLFAAANRDDRMGAYYTRLLEGWKEAGGKQFVLFTAPQSFNRYGFFGIKEHLGSTRESSPKYDAALTFQEALSGCWPEFVEGGC